MENTKFTSLRSKSLIKITRASDRLMADQESKVSNASHVAPPKKNTPTAIPVEILAGRVRKKPKGRFVSSGKLESGSNVIAERYEAEQASYRRVSERKICKKKSCVSKNFRNFTNESTGGSDNRTFSGDKFSSVNPSHIYVSKDQRYPGKDGGAFEGTISSQGCHKSFDGKAYTPRRAFVKSGGERTAFPASKATKSSDRSFGDRPSCPSFIASRCSSIQSERKPFDDRREKSFSDGVRRDSTSKFRPDSSKSFDNRRNGHGSSRSGSPFGSLGKSQNFGRSKFSGSRNNFKGPKGHKPRS